MIKSTIHSLSPHGGGFVFRFRTPNLSFRCRVRQQHYEHPGGRATSAADEPSSPFQPPFGCCRKTQTNRRPVEFGADASYGRFMPERSREDEALVAKSVAMIVGRLDDKLPEITRSTQEFLVPEIPETPGPGG